MPEYLDSLRPDTTLGFVFTDLNTQVSNIITELEGYRRLTSRGQAPAKQIPDTGLEFDWPRKDTSTKGRYRTTVVLASGNEGEKIPLLQRVDELMPPQYGARPESVAAYRRQEKPFPDYAVEQETAHGVITFRLGRMGIRGEPSDKRFVGITAGKPEHKLANLEKDDFERVKIVTAQLVRGIGIVENMVLGGISMSLEDAEAEMDTGLAAAA